MAWDFETDPEYQAQLDWADEFVRDEVEPLDLVWRGVLGIADGPTEVHKAAARAKYAEYLEHEVGNQ